MLGLLSTLKGKRSFAGLIFLERRQKHQDLGIFLQKSLNLKFFSNNILNRIYLVPLSFIRQNAANICWITLTEMLLKIFNYKSLIMVYYKVTHD